MEADIEGIESVASEEDFGKDSKGSRWVKWMRAESEGWNLPSSFGVPVKKGWAVCC